MFSSVTSKAITSARTESEKDLRLSLLETEFYKSCSALSSLGIELEQERNCLLLELLQIEEKKTLTLRQEIEKLKVNLLGG